MNTSNFWSIFRVFAFAFLITAISTGSTRAQTINYTVQEKVISEKINKLRAMSDNERAVVTKSLAVEIRSLPVTMGKVRLANALGSLSTEGDLGHDVLQEVANTLSSIIQEYEQTGQPGKLPYKKLAVLARYEGVQTSLNNQKYQAAMAELEEADRLRADANFTLSDLHGKKWTLKDLKGKVVLVNFWATWCPPCRKEIPDLIKLYDEFKGKNFVVLGVSDDDPAKLKSVAEALEIKFPIIIDTDGKVQKSLGIEGIPATLIYDCDGKLAAQAVDMRTRQQFLQLLAQAGLKQTQSE
jgi:peroxiredoxin